MKLLKKCFESKRKVSRKDLLDLKVTQRQQKEIQTTNY